MADLRDRLQEIADEKYADFQAKLCPTLDREIFVGVRIPVLKKFAKGYYKENESAEFMKSLPHKLYDENMLHAILLMHIKNYDECVEAIEEFLPYVDNWAVCDTIKPKVFVKNKAALLDKIKIWTTSKHTYTCRFGIEMLMTHFLDEDYKPEYHELVSVIRSDEYYINMMIAWYFATALAKQYDTTLPILLENKLDVWTHNKTIQKARESYRITDEQKEYLNSLKRK